MPSNFNWLTRGVIKKVGTDIRLTLNRWAKVFRQDGLYRLELYTDNVFHGEYRDLRNIADIKYVLWNLDHFIKEGAFKKPAPLQPQRVKKKK